MRREQRVTFPRQTRLEVRVECRYPRLPIFQLGQGPLPEGVFSKVTRVRTHLYTALLKLPSAPLKITVLLKWLLSTAVDRSDCGHPRARVLAPLCCSQLSGFVVIDAPRAIGTLPLYFT